MKDYTKANKLWWDKATHVHEQSRLYNVSTFKKTKNSLESIEQKELPNIKGKSMLHLMCHFGMDSLSWAHKGALVTGSDLSHDSMELAKKLSKETGIPATFICSDIYDLPKVLDKKFDVVYMSYGVLLWLSDIKKWGKLVHDFLKKGGIFYMVELHPFTNMLNEKGELAYSYFDNGPYEDESSGTYTDWNAEIKGKTYQWGYTLSDVTSALINAGLTIDFIHEFPFTTYEQYPGQMSKNKKGEYQLKNNKEVPLLFSIQASK